MSVGAVLAATATPAAAPGRPPPQVQIQVTRSELGRPIPPGFLGLSLEFSSLYAYAGEDPRAPNPVFTQLIANLDGQGPTLRIGGDSTDRTWWPVAGMAKPPWAAYTLTPNWTAVARGLAQALGAHLILGINLLADSRSVASTEAKAFVDGIGRARIAAFEIGNEPEQYSTLPWYWTSRGKPVLGRLPSYDFRSYLAQVTRIRTALPSMALAGPATGTLAWLSQLPALLKGEPGLREVTFHRYPLNRCVSDPRSPEYPSVPHLLSRKSSAGLVAGVGRWVALAHRHGTSFRVDELNAVTCGGKAGVSDTFASALWTLDTEFWMARTGVDGVDVHVHPGAPANQLFTFARENGRWVGSVRPQYYGLLLFAQAAPPGARLLRLTGAASDSLRSWATLGPDGRIRVILINDSLTRAAAVLVRPPAPAGTASIERLDAPSAYAKTDVTLGGQSFGSRTLTGRRDGAARVQTVRLARGGYRVQVPAASAAMLTIPAG